MVNRPSPEPLEDRPSSQLVNVFGHTLEFRIVDYPEGAWWMILHNPLGDVPQFLGRIPEPEAHRALCDPVQAAAELERQGRPPMA